MKHTDTGYVKALAALRFTKPTLGQGTQRRVVNARVAPGLERTRRRRRGDGLSLGVKKKSALATDFFEVAVATIKRCRRDEALFVVHDRRMYDFGWFDMTNPPTDTFSAFVVSRKFDESPVSRFPERGRPMDMDVFHAENIFVFRIDAVTKFTARPAIAIRARPKGGPTFRIRHGKAAVHSTAAAFSTHDIVPRTSLACAIAEAFA
jgi:hypothetical protein